MKGRSPAGTLRRSRSGRVPGNAGDALAPEDVPAYLRELGLLPAREAGGRVTVTDVSRRNRNYRVVRPSGQGFLLKQGWPGPEGDSVRHEARLLASCAEDGPLAGLRPLVARFLGYHERRRILVASLIPGARPLCQLVDAGEDLAGACARLGAALALVHRQEVPPEYELGTPWALCADLPPVEVAASAGPAHMAVLRIVQADEALREGLAAARRAWRPAGLLHGDVRGDNVLVAGSGAQGAVHLVDWEGAQRGDPAWDVGGAFHELLGRWVCSIPLGAGPPMREQLAGAQRPLHGLRPAFRALWNGYREASCFGDGEARELLARAIRSCGARLVQAAWEACTGTLVPPNVAVAHLQLASNLLSGVEAAALRLLGIPWPALPSAPAVARPAAPPVGAR